VVLTKDLFINYYHFKTSETEYEVDASSLKNLCEKNNFKDYKSILETNQPRISGIVLYAYANSMIQLAKIYKESKQTDKIDNLIDLYETNFKIGLNTEYEDRYLNAIKE